jgi:HSP20 family protein
MFDYPRSGTFNLLVSYQTNYYRPPLDVIETDKSFLVRIEIAGVNEKDFSIKFDKNALLISGFRQDPMKNQSFHQMEISFGEFEIKIHLPQQIDRDSIKAEYKNGFLEIILIKVVPQEIFIKDKDA